MEPISAVIIAKNESYNLKQLLPRLQWCAEIVVVDDFSEDDTLEVCRSFGCATFQRKLEGFGEQKQFAVSKTTNKWVFSIDADELPSEELVREISALNVSDDHQLGGYSISRRHEFMGRVFKHSAESKTAYLRLFDKTRANFNSARVHEVVETSCIVRPLKMYLTHHSFRDLGHYFEKSNRYSSLAAESAFAAGKRKNMLVVLLVAPLLFLKTYLIDSNYREGLPGIFWAMFQNWYRIVKYAKLWEMHYGKSDAPQ